MTNYPLVLVLVVELLPQTFLAMDIETVATHPPPPLTTAIQNLVVRYTSCHICQVTQCHTAMIPVL